MSRLAHLLTQVTASAQTQDKLSATYFDSAPAPMRPAPWQRWLLFCGVAVLGVAAGLLITVIVAPGGWKHHVPRVYPLLTFDDSSAEALLGRQFGLWWGTPGHAGESLALTLDPDMHAGSSGRSLRIDYVLPAASVANAPSGLWFLLPAAPQNQRYQLEFQIRGDERTGDVRQAIMELRNQSMTEQRPLTITSEWATMRVPLQMRIEPDGQPLAWQECRILFNPRQTTSTRGRVYIDQIRLTEFTP